MATIQEVIADVTREAGETRTQLQARLTFLVAFRARVEELLANAATPEAIEALQLVAADLDAGQAEAQAELDKPIP